MNTTGIPAKDAVEKVLKTVAGLPGFLTGSSATAVATGRDHAYTDVDLFVPNQGAYFTMVQHLLNNGYAIEGPRFERMWQRHLTMGFNAWHTNSMKLNDMLTGTEVNVIYKRVDNHETTQLSQVIESFDFGVLGVGYETDTGTFRDMRSYLFPGAKDLEVLPLMKYREETVGQGYMSQHIMMRTPGRYARYVGYGYDLSLVKPSLIRGLGIYADYKSDRTKPEEKILGEIAQALETYVRLDMFDQLTQFEKDLPKADGLDDIMASLE